MFRTLLLALPAVATLPLAFSAPPNASRQRRPWMLAERGHGDVEEELAGRPPWRRLFLDAMVTEELRGVERVFHAAGSTPATR